MPKETTYPESGLWKDFFTRERVENMANVLARASRSFNQRAFVQSVCTDDFFTFELKQRITHIAQRLREFLPARYSDAVKVLIKAAPQLKEFENWVLTSYVEQFGLDEFDTSVAAMEELTKHGTSEFAIRPFMIRFTDRMLPILHTWAQSDNHHVRRLAAEGSRPRGVWVAHIEPFKKDPAPVFELLERLKADESLYVRKAVANNLNDISRDHPEKVIALGARWLKSGDKNTAWIVRHACRTLIKRGHPKVFPLFGFAANPRISVSSFSLSPKRVRVGTDAEVRATVVSTGGKAQRLSIDYSVHYLKKNGKHQAKVFKLVERTIRPGERLDLKSNHSFREMTTRRHYPGEHVADLIINGKAVKSCRFRITD